MNYYEDLRSDFEDLNLSYFPKNVGAYSDLRTIAHGTNGAWLPHVRETALGLEQPLRTQIGQQIVQYHEQAEVDVLDEDRKMYSFCAEAEKQLLTSISPEHIDSELTRPPVIYEYGGKALAIRKTSGEGSSYVLRDCIPYGLVAGTFAGVKPHIGRWYLPLRSGALSCLHDDQLFYPGRFSIFSIPIEERSAISIRNPSNSDVIQASHEDIVNRCDQLLRGAARIISITEPIGQS